MHDQTRRVLEVLRVSIRLQGITHREIEQRLGWSGPKSELLVHFGVAPIRRRVRRAGSRRAPFTRTILTNVLKTYRVSPI